MQVTVLGGCGAWPTAEQACSGYLVEHEGYRALIDPGYATLPRLLEHVEANQIDAVLVTHAHPDHCADLSPLLRARALPPDPPAPLPCYALPGALDAVLALDARFIAWSRAAAVTEFAAGDRFPVGPFIVDTRALPHSLPNAGFRLSVDGTVLAYTGDNGPDPAVVELADGADLFIAEATYVESVTDPDTVGLLSSAIDAARQAQQAGVARLVLTHLWPGTDPADSLGAARTAFDGPIEVARPDLVLDVTGR